MTVYRLTNNTTATCQISDEVCLAALRGWNGWEPDADLSKVQTAPETKAAWRRAISAALVALSDEVCEALNHGY